MQSSKGRTASLDAPPAFWAVRPRPTDKQKTIIVTGAPRGGTTFVASILAQLGVSFGGSQTGRHAEVGARYQHASLTLSYVRDRAEFERIRLDIDRKHDVWAIKNLHFDWEEPPLRNPHYIIVLKEPLSVAGRSLMMRGRPFNDSTIMAGISDVLTVYSQALDFCRRSKAPVLLLSYERADKQKGLAIEAIAQFLGIADHDTSSAIVAMKADQERYFASAMGRALKEASG